MAAAPFMQLYVGDYLADTQDLTCEEHGAYLLLLMTMWRHDAKLPNDPKKLARIARLTARRWDDVWPSIARFFTVDGDSITNKRLVEEYKKAAAKSDLRADAGRKGGQAKALKSKEVPVANDSDLPKHSSDIRYQIDKEEEAKASSKKIRASRLSEDWTLPDDWRAWAEAEGFSAPSINGQADRFRDYWISQPGQKGVKANWLATWRNWMRNNATAPPLLRAVGDGFAPQEPIRIRPKLPKELTDDRPN